MQLGFSSIKKRKVSQNDLGRARVAKKLATDPEILRDRNKFHSFLEDFADYYLDPIYKWAGSMHETIKDAFGSGEYINTSAGSADAGKPIVLDSSGLIAQNMLTRSLGYTLPVSAAVLTPVTDGTTYYIGAKPTLAPGTVAGGRTINTLSAGTITGAVLKWEAGTAGSGENISVYVATGGNDYLVETIGDTNGTKVFNKNDLAVAVSYGDLVELKMVCPTWATNPDNVYLHGHIYISI